MTRPLAEWADLIEIHPNFCDGQTAEDYKRQLNTTKNTH